MTLEIWVTLADAKIHCEKMWNIVNTNCLTATTFLRCYVRLILEMDTGEQPHEQLSTPVWHQGYHESQANENIHTEQTVFKQ
jgi:hypothetical protein